MAMAGGGGGTRRRGRRFRRAQPMAQINVTPFVDVMLVLLIVFMVTAPLLTVGVPVELPKTDAAQLHDPEEPLVVTVDDEGAVYIQEQQVPPERLVPTLMEVTDANPEARIFVRGDRALAYGTIMDVMGRLSGAGFRRVSLVAEQPQGSG